MSELRVNNIVSEDGSAAPIYSRGMNIGAGTTLTCDGNFVVGGATSIAGTVEVGGLFKANTLTPLTGDTVTISSGKFLAVGGGVTVTNAGTFTVSGPTSFQSGAVVTGVVTFTEADLQASLTLDGLDVGSNIKLGNAGVITATSFSGDGSGLTGIDATTIVNGTSNVTVAASGDITVTRAGSTRATFNNVGADIPGTLSVNRLVVDDDGSAQPTTVIKADDNGPWALCIKNDTYNTDENTGLKFYQNNTGECDIQLHGGSAYKSLTFRQYDGSTQRNTLNLNADSAVQLYYDGNEKLKTVSTGIDVTGTVNCDGLTCEGDAYIQSGLGVLRLKDTNNTGTGAQNYIAAQDSAGTQQWYLGQTSNGGGTFEMMNQQNSAMYFGTNNTWRAYLTNAGHFVPNADSSYDLGENGIRWRNIYGDTIYGNGSNLTNTGGLKSMQVFASAGNYVWTKPAGITRIKVYVTGGGGGAGWTPGDNQNDMGQGGAAGGTAIEIIDVSSVSSVNVTVGAGGAGGGSSGTAGSHGGTSSFGSYCSATGGDGSGASTAFVVCVGGVGSGGNINMYGQGPAGNAAINYNSGGSAAIGGGGGNSFWGGGGSGGRNGSSPTNGNVGGGGGAPANNVAGGNGGTGIIVVEEYS